MTRKELVQALEEKWEVKATYLGVPSCAYEIRCSEGIFLVDRQGVVRDQDGREFSAEELLDKPKTETMPIDPGRLPVDGYVVELPLAGHTAASLRNLVNMLASKQQLLVNTFGLKKPFIEFCVAEEFGKRNIEEMSDFQAAWIELGPRHCPGLAINFEEQTLVMKLLKDNPTPEEMTAFADLVACMNEHAKKLKHASFKLAQDDNPKFALRTWLLRLGMNGERFKTTRKVLLARLSGSAAFRTPAEEEKHKARLLAKKSKQVEVDGDVC